MNTRSESRAISFEAVRGARDNRLCLDPLMRLKDQIFQLSSAFCLMRVRHDRGTAGMRAATRRSRAFSA